MDLSIEQLELRVGAESRDQAARVVQGLEGGLKRIATGHPNDTSPEIAVGRLVIELPDDAGADGRAMGEQIAIRLIEAMRNFLRRDESTIE